MSTVAIEFQTVTAALEPAPINPAWVRMGRPVARNAVLFGGSDRAAGPIVWECSPGAFDWHYDVDETILVLEGSVVLDDGVRPARRVGPGDIVLFPAGAFVHWKVETRVRKLAFFGCRMPRAWALAHRTLQTCRAMLDTLLTPRSARGESWKRDAFARAAMSNVLGSCDKRC